MERAIALSERSLTLPRVTAVILGAVFVAAAAQIAVPLPGTPVPMTLQPLAVLLVGGLLGARLGATSMVLYLALGIAGLPVFTPTVPLIGIARLLGPTGGYLLAYPVAAWVVGWLVTPGLATEGSPFRAPGVGKPQWLRVGLGVLAGLVLIHVGGLAQLAILTGDLSGAARLGTLPFLLGDLAKLAVATAVLTTLTPAVRARL
jgi:biotin transport system substrate-specific component